MLPPPDVFHHIAMLYEHASQGSLWMQLLKKKFLLPERILENFRIHKNIIISFLEDAVPWNRWVT